VLELKCLAGWFISAYSQNWWWMSTLWMTDHRRLQTRANWLSIDTQDGTESRSNKIFTIASCLKLYVPRL
jgi:hypothetical protein